MWGNQMPRDARHAGDVQTTLDKVFQISQTCWYWQCSSSVLLTTSSTAITCYYMLLHAITCYYYYFHFVWFSDLMIQGGIHLAVWPCFLFCWEGSGSKRRQTWEGSASSASKRMQTIEAYAAYAFSRDGPSWKWKKRQQARTCIYLYLDIQLGAIWWMASRSAPNRFSAGKDKQPQGVQSI